VGSVLNSATATIQITATVNSGTGGTVITNTAQVSAVDQADPDSTPNNSNAGEDDQSSVNVTVQALTLTDGMNASNVLGQANFTASTQATTQTGLKNPKATVYDAANNRLFVADTVNNRVLVYAGSTITNGQAAINVLGQVNFTQANSPTTQSSMSQPQGLAYDSANQRLFVSDYSNRRVLVYDVNSITDGENAVNVLGQAAFNTSTQAVTQAGQGGPVGLAYDSGAQRLFVSDNFNNRVLVYDVNAITNGENAINVLGQTTFTGGGAAVIQMSVQAPTDLAYDSANQRLFVVDAGHQRPRTVQLHLQSCSHDPGRNEFSARRIL
jgi:DNA-binding beta-propeller fold protein YncE